MGGAGGRLVCRPQGPWLSTMGGAGGARRAVGLSQTTGRQPLASWAWGTSSGLLVCLKLALGFAGTHPLRMTQVGRVPGSGDPGGSQGQAVELGPQELSHSHRTTFPLPLCSGIPSFLVFNNHGALWAQTDFP